jgi:hypothetical protein
MWPLHSRSRPLGHSFAPLHRSSAPPPADARAPPTDSRAPSSSSSPATPPPAAALSARRRLWQRRLSGRAFHLVVLTLVLVDLATIVADLVLVLTHSEYRPTPAVESAARTLAATSLAILSLFCVEFAAAAAAFGPRNWLREPLHCFDVFVVLASLALEAALFHLEGQHSSDGAGLEGVVSLLVAGRLWRLARVAYTATEATKAEEEFEEAARRRRRRGVGGGGGGGGDGGDGGEAASAAHDGDGGEVARLRRLVASLRAQLAEAGVAERAEAALPEAQDRGRGDAAAIEKHSTIRG